ncbi:hypothetical protein HUS84_28055 [Pseudomonas chlororaphis]|uniref:hypothetical protein n=1 Tax=Pseudomonas chlororaphis TaxID=587753 RepID=UPI001B327DC6|nr:hypothetical protein [Pseudomonas chlororaphis]MBP5077749.1 hypothetical protein [Pseudomonas chlororaphis]
MTIDYLQFPLGDYLNCNLLKDIDIQNLKGNSKILSVGVGHGAYEEYLMNALNVPRSSIYCADLNLDEKWKGPYSFQFDITDPWPNLNLKFDYILFGQVIGVSANEGRPVSTETMITHVMHIIRQAKLHLKENGKILIYDTTLPSTLIDQDFDAKPIFICVAQEFSGKVDRADCFGSQIEISF